MDTKMMDFATWPSKKFTLQFLVVALVALFVCYHAASAFGGENPLSDAQPHIVTATAQFHKIEILPCNRNQLISDHVQSVLQRIQNPPNCLEAKLLFCELEQYCGFGCGFHHVSHCLLMAAGGNRTLVFKNDGSHWSYKGNGWESIFQPVTKCKYDHSMRSSEAIVEYTGPSQTDRLVQIPVRGYLKYDTEHTYPVIASELANKLAHLHPNPPVWFLAQIMKFLWKLNAVTRKFIVETEANIPLGEGPIVGIHVRRTDKISEAKYQELKDYMQWVDLWYDQQQQENGIEKQPRRLFIATDEPEVLNEAKRDYGNRYQIFSSDSTQKGTDYSIENLRAFISDIAILVRCNYVVCTFSSNVCRLIYELKQIDTVHRNGSDLHSLDREENSGFPWDAIKKEYMQMAMQLGATSDGGLNGSSFLPIHLFRNASFPIFRMNEE